MDLLVGLGNPGPGYLGTRHNIGFRIAEAAARAEGIAIEHERYGGRFGSGTSAICPEGLAVLLPSTFMNRSGDSVALAALALGVVTGPPSPGASKLLVVYDDLDLPLGRIRLRPDGGAGGHRGMADVLDALGSSQVPRLRFGVGRPLEGLDPVDYVLEPFSTDQEQQLEPLISRAVGAVRAVLTLGIKAAMTEFNRDPAVV